MSRRALALVSVLALLCALGACSSDPDSPVGSEFIDDLLGSEPGVVFQDTITVSDDTVLAYAALLTDDDDLQLGRSLGYTRSIVLRPNFSNTNGDENRTVSEASLRLRLKEITGGEDILVRFYHLAQQYSEGDSLETLDTLGVILDPETGLADRVLQEFPAERPLPSELVQAWIRGDSVSNGIAVVYQDDGNERLARFDASEATGVDVDPPTIQVTFTDQTSSSYAISHDAVFVRPTETTSNLIVSDGFVRRVWFRVDLDQLSDSSAVHSARISFNLVPGTASGYDAVELYIPDTDDPTSPEFLDGRPIKDALFDDEDEKVEFIVTNTVLGILGGSLKDNGFVMRYVGENTGLRYAEFYTSAVDPLAPRVILTSSTPAEFDP